MKLASLLNKLTPCHNFNLHAVSTG